MHFSTTTSSSCMNSVTNTQMNENKRGRGSKLNLNQNTRGEILDMLSEPRRHSDAGSRTRLEMVSTTKLETHNKTKHKKT